MLYALAHPLSFVVLVASFVLGLTLHGWVQAWVARGRADALPARQGRTRPDPRRHLDPYGCVGALISGLGWARPVELARSRDRRVLVPVCLAGPLTNLVLGVGLLLLWRALAGPGNPFPGGAALVLQRGAGLSLGTDVLLLVGAQQLYLGVLSLVPLPPLDGGRLLFGLVRRSPGWARAEYQLVDRNIGLVVLLALLVVPLGGPVPLLPDLLDTLLAPLLRLLCGA